MTNHRFWTCYIFSLVMFFSLNNCQGQDKPGQMTKKINPIEKLELNKIGQIELKMKSESPPIGTVRRLLVINDKFFLLDFYSRKVFKFSAAGEFVRQIGGNGNGPGEYLFPNEITSDASGNIYILDNARILRYNDQGDFIKDLNRKMNLLFTDGIKIDNDFNILQLALSGEITKLRKFDRADMNQLYEVQLTRKEIYSVVRHLSGLQGFCYNSKSDYAYYLAPCEYEIQVIDISTGRIVKTFGHKPDSFRPLPEKYYTSGELGEPRLISKMLDETSILEGMFLIGNKYLLTGYSIDRKQKLYYWTVYDIESDYQAFDFNNYAQLFTEKVITAAGERLYLYSAPGEDEFEISNGIIEVYAFQVTSN